ncbi:MAG: flagellar protein FlaG [Clostridiales bacterium]|nr:flagellar protein FlaG [Clostridiales bacterium]
MNILLKNSTALDAMNVNAKSVPNTSVGETADRKNIQISIPSIKNLKSQKIFDKNVSELFENDEGKKAFEEVVDVANQIFFGEDNHFQFKVHEGTGRMMIKVVNTETGQVVKEVPPEKILNAVASLWELAGIIVDEKA